MFFPLLKWTVCGCDAVRSLLSLLLVVLRGVFPPLKVNCLWLWRCQVPVITTFTVSLMWWFFPLLKWTVCGCDAVRSLLSLLLVVLCGVFPPLKVNCLRLWRCQVPVITGSSITWCSPFLKWTVYGCDAVRHAGPRSEGPARRAGWGNGACAQQHGAASLHVRHAHLLPHAARWVLHASCAGTEGLDCLKAH